MIPVRLIRQDVARAGLIQTDARTVLRLVLRHVSYRSFPDIGPPALNQFVDKASNAANPLHFGSIRSSKLPKSKVVRRNVEHDVVQQFLIGPITSSVGGSIELIPQRVLGVWVVAI